MEQMKLYTHDEMMDSVIGKERYTKKRQIGC